MYSIGILKKKKNTNLCSLFLSLECLYEISINTVLGIFMLLKLELSNNIGSYVFVYHPNLLFSHTYWIDELFKKISLFVYLFYFF